MSARRTDRYTAWRLAIEAMHEVEREGFTAVYPSEPPEHARALLENLGVRVLVSPAVGARPLIFTPAELERFIAAYVACL